MTEVIFRRWPNGTIIALFPSLPGTNDPHSCLSYERHGQHAAASVGIIGYTEPAVDRSGDLDTLVRELVRVGYTDLKPVKRFTSRHFRERVKAMKRD